jgi:hypothetical protein
MTSNNQNAETINFLNIPGAVKITFDEMLAFEPPGHPIYVAPEKPFITSPNVIKIPTINFNDLTNLIDGILANIGKIEINKIHDWCYSIEYHPVDGIKIYPRDECHRNKWWSSISAADEALKKFPHNLSNLEHYDDPINYGFRGEWFKMELRIYYCTADKCYILEFNRMCGEAFSFYKICDKIKAQIKETFTTPNLLWLIRKNYIYLIAGTPFNINYENQITRYLLNDMLSREICSFLGV